MSDWQDSPGQFLRDAAAGGLVLSVVALALLLRWFGVGFGYWWMP